eukprot:Tbor_TRINITY_DN5640_c0_g3::TRINITY_DN5640_c0_g3_i1::g.8495::m.8495/K11827/AP2S1; AP-2 complex subunit sigma-1
MIHFILLQNRIGKTRLAKWYVPCDDSDKERQKVEISALISSREGRFTNFVDYRNIKIVYRRYAGLFFCFGVDRTENELSVLEFIHLLVDVLDMFFTDVCELDLVFNFHKVHMILDEMIMAGEIQEMNKQIILERLSVWNV